MDYLMRMYKEQEELDERYVRLAVFIKTNKIFSTLSWKKRMLMRIQRFSMWLYLKVLGNRIALERKEMSK